MPQYNGNNEYLEIDGYDLSGLWTQTTQSLTVDDEDISAGSGIAWKEHADKLSEISLSFTIIYEADSVPGYIWRLTKGSPYYVKRGPEGNAAGKPAHWQNFKLNSINGPSTTADKSKVMFEGQMVSTGSPDKNIYDGDVW